MESIKDKDDYGVLLIDGLGAKYPKSTENMENSLLYSRTRRYTGKDKCKKLWKF